MANSLVPRITGSGFSVPAKTRKNDDPIFDWIKENIPDNDKLFTGYDIRHILGYEEDLMTMMVPAAQAAMTKANIQPGDVDILLGTGSVGSFRDPNQLSELHNLLGLSPQAWVIPVVDDFSNFNSALLIADGLLKAGRTRNILICIGGNWSTNVDYHTPQSVSAADGAGAVVMSMSDNTGLWAVADQYTISATNYFGTMFTGRVQTNSNQPYGYGYGTLAPTYTSNFFQITKAGMTAYSAFGKDTAYLAAQRLMTNNNLQPADIAFMPHQSSEVLFNYWVQKLGIPPAQNLNTIALYANITVATHILNFAHFDAINGIKQDNLVMLALGPDIHANAMLLQRGI